MGSVERVPDILEDSLPKRQKIEKPRKCDYRQRAHCNPLADSFIVYPESPDHVEEKCFSSTEKSPASAILEQNLLIDVDFGAWHFSRRRIINGEIF